MNNFRAQQSHSHYHTEMLQELITSTKECHKVMPKASTVSDESFKYYERLLKLLDQKS